MAQVKYNLGRISSNVSYSTTEQYIGTWIDGKPLYEITITGNKTATVTSNGTAKVNSVDLSYLKMESVMIITAFIIDNDCVLPLPTFDGKNSDYHVEAYINENKLELWSSSTNYNNNEVVVVLRYTKTTD